MDNTFERLFFALWPTEYIRQQFINHYSEQISLLDQGKRVSAAKLHITLHFLGNIPVNKVSCFIDQAEQIHSPSFQLEINQLGYFKKPGISWLGLSKIPQSLFYLQKLLGENIKQCGFKPESRPYRPHVTMMRKVRQSSSMLTGSISPVEWKVDSFALIKSTLDGDGVKYTVKNIFPLYMS